MKEDMQKSAPDIIRSTQLAIKFLFFRKIDFLSFTFCLYKFSR